jgi:Trk K+ transport system NAD-binding subunit
VIYDTNYSPAIVFGAGKVGQAAVRAIRRRDFPVHVIERDQALCATLANVADLVIRGDAADR